MLKGITGIFNRDLTLSASVIRVLFGIMGILLIYKLDQGDYQRFLDGKTLSQFEPIGVLQFLGDLAINPTFLNTLTIVGYIACITQILGLLSRVSAFINWFTCLVLASLIYSWGIKWSHGFNVMLIAMFPMMFMPLGAYFSLDNLLFRNRKRGGNNGWAVQLSVISVSLMYFNAFIFKMTSSGIDWALSDSLRNYIIDLYLVQNVIPIPFHLQFIVNNEWAWTTVALGNLIVQGSAILAIFFLNRPWMKLFFGCLFVLETLGLGIVMNLWNLKWLFVFAIYIDWDYFFNKYKSKSILQSVPLPKKMIATSFMTVYLVLSSIVMFDLSLKLENQYKTYPISSFPMFKSLKVHPPYDEHLPLHMKGNTFIATNNDLLGIDQDLQEEIKKKGAHIVRFYKFREIWDTDRVRSYCDDFQTYIQRKLGVSQPVAFEWRRTHNICPPYPESPKILTMHDGLIAQVDKKGNLKTVRLKPIGKTTDDFYLELHTVGYDSLIIEDIYAYEGHEFAGPNEVDWRRRGNRLYVNKENKLIHLAIVVRDSGDLKTDTYLSSTFKKNADGTIFTN